MEDNKEIIVKYSSYTPAQKKATLKYRENNKEKVKLQRKAYYDKRKLNDPLFLESKRLKAIEYYKMKKLNKKCNEIINIIPKQIIEEIIIIEPKIEYINIEETKDVKPLLNKLKRKYIKKL